MEKTEIRSLTGLRGVAAGLVTAYHFYPTDPHAGPLGHSLGRGYLWVDLFFVLSGFVLALNYGELFERGCSARAFVEFVLRRLARIYPLYIVIALLQLGFTLSAYGDFAHREAWGAAVLDRPTPDIGANLLLVQAWGISGSVVGQAWSVSTEWAAYFAFPLLASVVVFGRRRMAVVAGAIALLLLLAVTILDARDGAYHSGPMDAYDGASVGPLLRCLGDFIFGLLMVRLTGVERVRALAAHDATAVLVLATLGLMFVLGAPDLAICMTFPAVVLCLAVNRGVTGSLFGNAAVHRLGVLSYSTYLLHGFVALPLQRLAPMVGTWAAAAVVWSGLLLMASATYRLIELPGRRVLRRRLARLIPAGTATAAPAASPPGLSSIAAATGPGQYR